MDQPPVDNETDFVVHPQPLIGASGEMLVAIVKGTWHLPRGASHLELAREIGIESPMSFRAASQSSSLSA